MADMPAAAIAPAARWRMLGHTAVVLAELPRGAADDLIARLDRVVPGRIEGFYVVGSASMGAFRPGQSDLDFVAIVDGEFRSAELRRLRALHVGRWVSTLIHDPYDGDGHWYATGSTSRLVICRARRLR